ncbi:uncharacterized protein [Hemitrygon akajei]|uniref:uncharacterized protein isoform X2 n=1 Tax=Hemitrygon akajei TaxID=2704970 RepID=UPI003BFA295A
MSSRSGQQREIFKGIEPTAGNSSVLGRVLKTCVNKLAVECSQTSSISHCFSQSFPPVSKGQQSRSRVKPGDELKRKESDSRGDWIIGEREGGGEPGGGDRQVRRDVSDEWTVARLRDRAASQGEYSGCEEQNLQSREQSSDPLGFRLTE